MQFAHIGEFPPKSMTYWVKFKHSLGANDNLCQKQKALGDGANWPHAKYVWQIRRGRTKFMTDSRSTNMCRRGFLGAFAATTLVAAPTFSNAFGLLRGAGDIRRINMYSGRTGESLETIYWIEGNYIKDAMKEVNYFMRDWRTDETIGIDPRTLDIMAASLNLMDVQEPYMMLSGYRSAKTNAMLRSRSRRVAKNSLHIEGKAADLRLKTRSVSQMTAAAKSCNAGGVGRYARSNFVHMDCGPIRTWRG